MSAAKINGIESDALALNLRNKSEDDDEPGPNECSICFNDILDAAQVEGCQHTYCRSCLTEWSRTCTKCPICRKPFLHIQVNLRSEHEYDSIKVVVKDPADRRRRFSNGQSRQPVTPDELIALPIKLCLGPLPTVWHAEVGRDLVTHERFTTRVNGSDFRIKLDELRTQYPTARMMVCLSMGQVRYIV